MKEKERVIIVVVDDGSLDDVEGFIEEMEGLVEAADGEAITSVTQKVTRLNPATIIGTGKLNEVKNYIDELDVDTAVFSVELSGSQLRNIEKVLKVKVLDRTMLILDIFARRATSAEGKLQVSLAQLEYRLPRLAGFGESLSRLGGGIGTRGPGEQKIETDRRHIRREIDSIKAKLRDVEQRREVQRKRRRKQDIAVVAIVGYTNAGKSTILNGMLRLNQRTDGAVLEKDMVFATLEPGMRRVTLPRGTPVILADTVGFVTHLPTALVEAFKGTLEEVKEADLIVQVVDGSDTGWQNQWDTTMQILEDLEAQKIPRLVALNKMDCVENHEHLIGFPAPDALMMSAKKEEDLVTLAEWIESELQRQGVPVQLLIPYHKAEVLNHLMNSGRFTIVEHTTEGSLVQGRLREGELEHYRSYDLIQIKEDV